MFDLDANMPRYRPWNGVPDIRNWQQIAEQSSPSHYLMLTSPIKGTPTDGTVLVSDEYLGSLVGLEQRFRNERKVPSRP